MAQRTHIGGVIPTVVIVFFMLASYLHALVPPVNAEEEQLSFRSDFQQQVQDEEVMLLQGNVEVHFREFIIYADEVRLNDEKDEFFGVGNIRLVGADRDIFADSIWFNYARNDFDMRNARGSMVVSGVGELVWFEAERLKGNINDYKMINGQVTTCTPEERREYHVRAGSIKVLPGNKIIFRNGYMFLFNAPVLWFPYWAFSLAETPWTIEAGKDNFNGTYVRTRYNYLAEELIIGALIMEYYSRRGWKIGADHSYVLPRHGNGSIRWNFLYGTYRNDATGDVVHANEYTVNIAQALKFGKRFTGNVQFGATSNYNIASGRRNDANGSFSASYNTTNTRTNFNFNGRAASGLNQSSSITTQISHNRTIFDNITTTASIDYKVNKSGEFVAADEEFNTRLELRQQMENQGWNWSAIVDSHWDPDGFTYPADRNRSYTDKLPEINLTFQPNAFPPNYRNILGFAMQNLNFLGALYYIGPERDEINGFYGRMDTRFTRTDRISTSSQVQTNVDFWQAIASTGDARYVYGIQSNWTWDLSQKLKWQLSWTRQDEKGRIPFQGMNQPSSPSNRLGWTLNYQNGRLYTIRFGTGYVLNERYAQAAGQVLSIGRLQPLSISVNYTPTTDITASLSTQWDFQNSKLGNVSSSFTMRGDWYNLQSNLNFSPPDTITSWASQATFVVGPDWDFRVSTEFAPKASSSIIRTVEVTHRLDCSFLSFRYRAQDDFWGVTWGITAFPQAHLGYSTTEQAFGPGIFDSFSGSGSGFSGGGLNLGGLGGYGNYGGGQLW